MASYSFRQRLLAKGDEDIPPGSILENGLENWNKEGFPSRKQRKKNFLSPNTFISGS